VCCWREVTEKKERCVIEGDKLVVCCEERRCGAGRCWELGVLMRGPVRRKCGILVTGGDCEVGVLES
jgi:hypothetical protein